jgi:chromosome segregation ATPase
VIEAELGARFSEATRLEGRLKEVATGKGEAEATIALLQAELAETQAALATAQANEASANAEIDEANRIIQELERTIEERDGAIATARGEVGDLDAINRGLEDDKEELQAQLKAARAQLEAATAAARGEVDRALSAQSEAASSSAATIRALTAERDRLAADLAAASRRVAELEKSAGFGEVEAAKLRAEREAAITARAELAAELDRIRSSLDAKEASVAATMANFNRTQELQFNREREVAQQVAGLTDRLMAATKERDDLRAAETSLRADLRDAAGREARLAADLAAVQATAADLARRLEASRAEYTQAAGELVGVKAGLEKAVADAAATSADLEDRLAVATGKLVEVSDKLRAAQEAETEWRRKEGAWAAERTQLSADKTRAEESSASMSKEIETLRESLGASEESKEMKLCEANKERLVLHRRVKEMKAMEIRAAERDAEIARLQDALYGSEVQRRALHNTVQELKGNIRVYVRVRPFLPADADPAAARVLAGITNDEDAAAADFVADATPAVAVAPDGTTVEMAAPPTRGIKDGALGGLAKRETKPARFNFDHVFGQRCGQEDIFDEVSHLVQSGAWSRVYKRMRSFACAPPSSPHLTDSHSHFPSHHLTTTQPSTATTCASSATARPAAARRTRCRAGPATTPASSRAPWPRSSSGPGPGGARAGPTRSRPPSSRSTTSRSATSCA